MNAKMPLSNNDTETIGLKVILLHIHSFFFLFLVISWILHWKFSIRKKKSKSFLLFLAMQGDFIKRAKLTMQLVSKHIIKCMRNDSKLCIVILSTLIMCLHDSSVRNSHVMCRSINEIMAFTRPLDTLVCLPTFRTRTICYYFIRDI